MPTPTQDVWLVRLLGKGCWEVHGSQANALSLASHLSQGYPSRWVDAKRLSDGHVIARIEPRTLAMDDGQMELE